MITRLFKLPSAINVFAVCHSQYQDYQSVIVNFIHHAIDSNPDSLQVFPAGHFNHARRSRILGQQINFCNNP